jgi:hypothetical protein
MFRQFYYCNPIFIGEKRVEYFKTHIFKLKVACCSCYKDSPLYIMSCFLLLSPCFLLKHKRCS